MIYTLTIEQYVSGLENDEILTKFNDPAIKFIGQDTTPQSYGLNIFFCHAWSKITPDNKLETLRHKYNGQLTIQRQLTIGRRKYAYLGEVCEFESLPRATYLLIPELPLCPVATIYDNTLVIFWDLSRKLPANREIWKMALEWGLEKLDKVKYPPKPSQETIRAGVLIAFKEIHKAGGKRLEDNVRSCKENTEQYLARSIEIGKEFLEYTEQLRHRNELAEKLDEKVVDFLNYMDKHAKVKEYAVDGKVLKITTKDLEMTFRKETLKLPEYVVRLNMETGMFTVSAPTVKGNIIHPHIAYDGDPCLGNYMTVYQKIVIAGEYRQLLDLIISYLVAYNDHSPISGWRTFKYAITGEKE